MAIKGDESAKALNMIVHTGNRKPALGSEVSVQRVFADNRLTMELFGAHHANLARIENILNVQLLARGNEVTIIGLVDAVESSCNALDALYERLNAGLGVGLPDVDAAIRMRPSQNTPALTKKMAVSTPKRVISPRSNTQVIYLKAIDQVELVFGQGPAGTGKTYLAVAKAVERLICGDVDRIILSRPAVEAGEQLGFLPGDMKEKVDPYLRPLYDALFDMLPEHQVVKRLDSGEIEIAPLAFMRGRTLSNAFVILDEAQNTTPIQMKMLLTRLGENSRMVINGDLTQVDLPRGVRSGLRDAIDVLCKVQGLQVVNFGEDDVVRHPLVATIVKAYSKVESVRRSGAHYEKHKSKSGQGENDKFQK